MQLTQWQNLIRFIAQRGELVLRPAFSWQPLTLRGAGALFFAIFLLRAFAVPESDLVCYILGFGLISLVIITAVSSLIIRLRLRNTLSVQTYFDNRNTFSQTPLTAGLTLLGSNLPPFYSLQLTRRFEAPGVTTLSHLVSGRTNSPRYLSDTLVFPHRGLWTLQSLSCTLADALGFTKLSWQVSCPSSVEISPPLCSIRPLPITASSARVGDQLSESRERSGDLFDLKSYDPSDGVKRILWKTYAKSGELVVRRPEPAILPEGEVCIYLVAGKDEDHVAGAFEDYLKQLTDNQIQVLFGTDGYHGEESAGVPFIKQQEMIRRIINHTVWDPETGSGKGFLRYLEGLRSDNRRTHEVIVFGPDQNDDWYREIERGARAHSISVVAAIVPKHIMRKRVPVILPEKRRRFAQLLSLLPQNMRPPPPATVPVSARIAQAGGKVLLCEASE